MQHDPANVRQAYHYIFANEINKLPTQNKDMQFYTFCIRRFLSSRMPILKPMLMRIKLIAIIMLAGCLQLSAAAYSQQITIIQDHVSIESVLKSIEKQTDYTFFYRTELFNNLKKKNVNLRQVSLQQALDQLLENQPVAYRIIDRIVVITPVKPITTVNKTIAVSGTVKDHKGNPIPGVTIKIKDTKTGVITDGNGNFKITADEQSILIAVAVGYKKLEVPVDGRVNLSLVLEEDISQLSQVVVIGYGKQSREKITDAITTVKGKELNQYAGSNFAQQLAGKAPGVVINDASAQPGTDPQIVIRGIGTLTAGRSPLIVVDGFPLSEGSSFNSINPQDIETLDILKDPASAAIYGSRAANGVILVTTKKGNGDQVKVALDVYSGFQQRNDKLKYVDAYQAAVYFTEARDWGYVSKDPLNRSVTDDRATRISKGAGLRELRLNYLQPYLDGQPGLTNTNWLDEIFRNAPMSSYNLSVSGASGKTNYYISSNYFNQDGIVINNGLQRYSGSFKLESKLSDKFTYGVSLNPSFNKSKYFNNNANSSNDIISDVTISYPFFPVYNSDGSLAISQQIKGNTPEDGALAESPVAIARKVKNNLNDTRIFGNTYLTYEPFAGLKFKALLGADIRTNFYDFYRPSDVGGYRAAAPQPASAIETNGHIYNYISENTVNYTKHFGQHEFDVLAGYTFQSENGANTIITGSGIPDDNITNIGGASAFNASTVRYQWTQISYLARLQYAYADKYLFSATIRRDGSSRFGDNNKWGNFPSVTAGYILSKESFFPQNKVLTFAKIRASYGLAGNNQIGSYSSKALIGSGSLNGNNDYNFNYAFGGALSPGFAAATTANNNLTWETKSSADFGLDLAFFQKFNLVVDYYKSTTRNLLLNVAIPEQSGFTNSIQNIGKVSNQGFEFELSGNNLNVGSFKIGFNANLATNVNKVLALAPGQTQIIQGTSSNFITKVGGPVAAMYGYNITGIYKTQDEINNSPHLPGTLTGDYKVADTNHDGVIDSRDQISYGTYNPKFTYGFGANISFKQFELNLAFNGVYGRKIYDYGLAIFDDSGEGFSVPSLYYFQNRYHPVDNPNGTFAQPNLGNLSSARRLTRAGSIFYYSGDYLRLRSAQLAYNLPEKLTSKVRISHVRVYCSANNLFTWTSFRGYNPDATSGNALTDGLSNSNYPVARSFIFGANITF